MRSSLVPLLLIALLLAPVAAFAAAGQAGDAQNGPAISPVGVWKTIDDATGRVKSIVSIREDGGKLYGKIEKLLDRPDDPDPKCSKCEGALKDKPMLGMQILWDLKKNGDQWSGGRVLDPNNGKTYKCYLALEEGGKKLKLRGFIGFSLLGRTQYWVREK